MSAQPRPRLTPEEYLAIERAAEFRSEYYDGRMYAMSGGTRVHARVIANLIRHLGNACGQGPCQVFAGDLRLRVSPAGLYTYPDATIVCAEPLLADDHDDTLLNPVAVFEVLSRSTEAYDRGFKSAQYRTIASLQEYVLVSQTEPRIEIYRRQSGGGWLLSEAIGMEALCRLESTNISIALADVYERVAFEPPVRPPGSPA